MKQVLDPYRFELEPAITAFHETTHHSLNKYKVKIITYMHLSNIISPADVLTQHYWAKNAQKKKLLPVWKNANTSKSLLAYSKTTTIQSL